MSTNYLSKPFCFSIPADSLRNIGEGSRVQIEVDRDSRIPVYFQSLSDSMGADAKGTGFAIYSGTESPFSRTATPISFMRITTNSITLVFGKPDSDNNFQDLYLDLFLWTSATGGDFTLVNFSDDGIAVRYGNGHGEAHGNLSPRGSAHIPW